MQKSRNWKEGSNWYREGETLAIIKFLQPLEIDCSNLFFLEIDYNLFLFAPAIPIAL